MENHVAKHWRYESDGGLQWTGHYWSHAAKTHYIVRDYGERIDCASKREAKALRDKLNSTLT